MNILKYPVSIKNYIIISDSLSQTTSNKLFIKVFRDYFEFLPAYKVVEICLIARMRLREEEYLYNFHSIYHLLEQTLKLVGQVIRDHIHISAILSY